MRQYTEVQPKLWKNLYQFYKDNDISSLSSEDQSKKLSEFLQQQGFSAQWAAVSAQIYINIMQKKDTMPEFPQELGSKTVSLSALDQAFLSSAFVNHESPEICRLLTRDVIGVTRALYRSVLTLPGCVHLKKNASHTVSRLRWIPARTTVISIWVRLPATSHTLRILTELW